LAVSNSLVHFFTSFSPVFSGETGKILQAGTGALESSGCGVQVDVLFLQSILWSIQNHVIELHPQTATA
jgi:hypothetical protein